MAKRMKTFRFRLYPNQKQTELINKTIDCVRQVYNLMLDACRAAYEATGKMLTRFDRNTRLTTLKQEPDKAHLREVDSTALQAVNDDLESALTAYLEKRHGFPQHRKEENEGSFTTKSRSLRVEGKRIFLPKIGWVGFAKSREVEGTIKRAVIVRKPSGKYFVSVICEVDIEPLPENDSECGVDLGYRRFITQDNGEMTANPKHLHNAQEKLAEAQRKLSRMQQGSCNWEKQRRKIARLHEHIANIRADILHKISTELVRENQTICTEDLNVRGMFHEHYMAKVLCDGGMGKLRRMLEYKADWYGRDLIAVPRDYPSSQICSVCGARNEKLGSRERWKCPDCGTVHDRDINAACNILRKGKEILAQMSPDK